MKPRVLYTIEVASHSYPCIGVLMSNPLYDSLFGIHKDNSAVLFVDPLGNDSITYSAFVKRVAQFAHAISKAGLQPGDRLVAQIGKSVSSIALYAGCVQAGVIFLPLNTAYTASEVEYFLSDSGGKLLICDPAAEDDLQPVASAQGAQVLTQSADGMSGSLIDQVNSSPESFETASRGEDDLAAFLYTSGTTGRSKGAMLTQENLLSNSIALIDLWQFTNKDVLLHALPVFHTHGLFVACNITFLAGSSMIFESKFDTDRVIALLPHSTSMMGVPTFYTRLLEDARFDKELTRNMRVFISGSAPLLSETHIQFEKLTGHRILERYGMTETNMITSNPYDGERRAGTVGFPLPGVDVKITDAQNGDILPDGEVGITEVRGPNVFRGYWNMPEKTAEELRTDGFFITGDLAKKDEDGYISIVGRNKDLIISGGYNIYPKEIELVLDDQPGVKETAVVGVPHPDFGETVVAIVVASDNHLDIETLHEAAKASLAKFKHPKKVIVVESLPRNTMGKVQKNILRDQYADLFA